MIEIDSEYMELPREARRSHLDLSEPCIERGGDSRNHKGVLAERLGTSIPHGRVCLCHACHNGKCSNWKHLYWGSDSDNLKDQNENGRKNFNQLTREKFGADFYKKLNTGNKAVSGSRWITDGVNNKRIFEGLPSEGWRYGRTVL